MAPLVPGAVHGRVAWRHLCQGHCMGASHGATCARGASYAAVLHGPALHGAATHGVALHGSALHSTAKHGSALHGGACAGRVEDGRGAAWMALKLPRAMCHVLRVMCHVSCVMCHVPCVLCHVPCLVVHACTTKFEWGSAHASPPWRAGTPARQPGPCSPCRHCSSNQQAV
eukprot:354045-Chlamydomonas_euryale.AAC.2